MGKDKDRELVSQTSGWSTIRQEGPLVSAKECLEHACLHADKSYNAATST